MPLALMFVALCAGITAALVWLSIGGSGLMALVFYVLSGQLITGAMLTRVALRAIR